MMKALQRLPKAEEQALIDVACANGLDRNDLACFMTRQQDEGVGRFKGSTDYFRGRTYRISYDLMLCRYCGNLMPSRICAGKVQMIKERLLGA